MSGAFPGRARGAVEVSRAGELAGKVAIVTGGASGIGRATALLFAREDAAVCIADIDGDGAELVTSIMADGGRAIFVKADVADAAQCSVVVETTIDAFGRLDILCNNAGIVQRASVVDTDEESWDRVMAVNSKSVYLMSRRAIPEIIEWGGGSIINTASGWGLAGGPRAAAYCASKGAVVQLTKAMAIDHGPDNVRVNCICPGDTDTPMLRGEAEMIGEALDGFLESSTKRPLGRVGRAEEIAEAALWLASDRSSFVTGAALVVDGGGLAGLQ